MTQKLEARGFSQAQAECIVEALGEINVALLATTHDLRDLELRLYKHFGGISSPTASAPPPLGKRNHPESLPYARA